MQIKVKICSQTNQIWAMIVAQLADTRGPEFESSRLQLLLNIFAVNCLEKKRN